MTCELELQWLAMAGLKLALIFASAHAGHIVFHGPREDVMPFFNSMVRISLRRSAMAWWLECSAAGVATRLACRRPELGSRRAECLLRPVEEGPC